MQLHTKISGNITNKKTNVLNCIVFPRSSSATKRSYESIFDFKIHCNDNNRILYFGPMKYFALEIFRKIIWMQSLHHFKSLNLHKRFNANLPLKIFWFISHSQFIHSFLILLAENLRKKKTFIELQIRMCRIIKSWNCK